MKLQDQLIVTKAGVSALQFSEFDIVEQEVSAMVA